jgi:hypothetical protein
LISIPAAEIGGQGATMQFGAIFISPVVKVVADSQTLRREVHRG